MPIRKPRIVEMNNFAMNKLRANKTNNFFTNTRWRLVFHPEVKWKIILRNSIGYSNINKLKHISNKLMKKASNARGYDVIFYRELSKYLYNVAKGNPENNKRHNNMLHTRIMARHRTPSPSAQKRARHN